MATNAEKLSAALVIVLADSEFMEDNSKVNKLLDAMNIKNGVTKQLSQAYTYGEKVWALAFANDKATKDSKELDIKTHILGTDAYKRFLSVPTSGDTGVIAKAEKAKADALTWIDEKFPNLVGTPAR